MLSSKIINPLYQLERFLRSPLESPSNDFSKQAIILSSYPKSGNTWLRFVVSNVSSIMNSDEEINFNSIEQYAPVIRGNRNLINMHQTDGVPTFLKSHSAYIPGFSAYKSVVIIRDPFKAIPSYRDYLIKARNKELDDISHFCKHWRYGFNAWAQFVSSWSEKATLFVKYEDLLIDPITEVSKIYSTLGFDIDIDIISKAIELSSRSNMKKSLESKGDPHNKNGFSFVRNEEENKGIRDIFTNETLEKDYPFFYQQAKKFNYI